MTRYFRNHFGSWNISVHVACGLATCTKLDAISLAFGFFGPAVMEELNAGRSSILRQHGLQHETCQMVTHQPYQNAGNSCFVNAALQVLSNGTRFVDACLGHEHAEVGDHCVACWLKHDFANRRPNEPFVPLVRQRAAELHAPGL